MKKGITTAGAIIISVSLLAPTVKAMTTGIKVPTLPNNVAVVRETEIPQQMYIFTEGENGEVTVSSALKFSDVPLSHWAYKDILLGVDKGYVDGMPDGTFAPDKAISRAEFIKMVVASLKLPVGSQQQGEPWFGPYIRTAMEYGLINVDEFGTYSETMNRQEMAKVAVRAVGKNAEYDEAFMLIAAENGLIMGTGDGSLKPEGTTTRAQSVTIIERILKVRAGETLPVDQRAIDNAREYAQRDIDPWGREIRKTNLPKNADDWPYILKELPNEFYELGPAQKYYNLGRYIPAKKFQQEYGITKEIAERVAERVDAYYNHILNVDYRTIDYTWAEKVLDLVHYSLPRDFMLEDLMDYVDWVKENRIIVVGKFKSEPSSFYANDAGRTSVRAYVEFKIESVGPDVDTKEESPVYNNSHASEFYERQGQLRKFYVDVRINGSLKSQFPGPMPVMSSDVLDHYVELM
jgi:hypothetical protein